MRLSLWRFVRQVILQGRDENGFGRLPGGPPRHRIYLSTAALKVLGDGRTLLSSARTGKSSFSDEAFGSSARALRRRRYKGLAALGQHKHSSFLFCCCPLDHTCPLHRRNRPADGRAADGMCSALRLFPHPTHPQLALRVAPAPSGTAPRCSASRQKTWWGRGKPVLQALAPSERNGASPLDHRNHDTHGHDRHR